MKIFLIGMPGSGKTTTGKLLAEKLKLTFVDLDMEIEKSEGQSINQIFEKRKENYFREVESRILKKFCSSTENFIMSTGGGSPCFYDNMKQMNDSGKTIFLDVPAKEIANRLEKTNLTERPLFSKLSLEQLKDKIEFLRSQRINFYKQANFVFEGKEISIEKIISKVTGSDQM
jgi:shikimate kinase